MEMVKLAGTPTTVVAEFMIANDVSGVSFGESSRLTQAAHNRLHEAFRTVEFIQREEKRTESIRRVFEEDGISVRTARVQTLLETERIPASKDLINTVRRNSEPAASESRFKIVG